MLHLQVVTPITLPLLPPLISSFPGNINSTNIISHSSGTDIHTSTSSNCLENQISRHCEYQYLNLPPVNFFSSSWLNFGSIFATVTPTPSTCCTRYFPSKFHLPFLKTFHPLSQLLPAQVRFTYKKDHVIPLVDLRLSLSLGYSCHPCFFA